MFPNMYGTKDMRITRFIVQETGTYNQMFRRPYETNLNPMAKNRIMEAVDRANKIVPTALIGVAQEFIQPSATPEAPILIPNGWNEPRFRFFMEVQTTDRTGHMVTKEYVMGYSDHLGVSYGNMLDPAMQFIVNGVNTMRETIQQTPLGTQSHHTLIDASHILVNNQYSGINSQNQMYGLRPEDVYDQIDHRQFKEAMNQESIMMDGRSKITGTATKSKRANSIAPVYMARMLDSYLQTARNQGEDGINVLLETARQTVATDTISEDPFMSLIRSRSGMTGGNSFTLKDLVDIDANVMNVLHFEPLSHTERATLHQAGQTNFWDGSNNYTSFVAALSQALPGYMLNFGVNKIHLTSTNDSYGSIMETKIGDMKSMQVLRDMSREGAAFAFRLESEVLKALTYGSNVCYHLEVMADLFGDMRIWLSLNHAPAQEFVLPCYADALFAPVTTTDFQRLDNAAGDFEQVMTDIYEVDSSRSAGGMIRTGLI